MEKLLERSELDVKYTWSTEAIFASDERWEEELQAVNTLVGQDPFAGVRGRLGESADFVGQYFLIEQTLAERLGKLQIYAHTKADQDTRLSEYQAMMSRVQSVSAEYAEQESFFEPELLSLPESLLHTYLQDDALADHRHALDNVIRNKPHVLSTETEAVIASFSDVLYGSGQIFSQLTNADFNHGSFTVDGTEYVVTEGRLGILLRNPDRTVRQLAYERLYDTYLGHKNAIAALYANSVKTDIRLARAKRFETARDFALFENNIPTSVYDALVTGVRNNAAHLHRYFELRRKRLGLDRVRLYDKYVPLVEAQLDDYAFEDGFRLIKEGLANLGDEYGTILDRAREERWIDVYETPGKRSGAYSTGFYATRPYILLNYQGNYNSVSTLAHELGHSVHTHLAGRSQLPQYSGYSIFLAEIASTVNETLLVNHLLDVTKDPMARATLINQQLDSLTGTIFRQTMFADFEWQTHREVEEGRALTHDSLCELYAGLNRTYQGEAYEEDDRSPAEWSRIPHFYRAYYVFQYATGMSAALVFADRIRKEGSAAADRYLGFLRAGSKDYPLEVLREAGLDMTNPDVVTQALSIYGELVTELERLLAVLKQ